MKRFVNLGIALVAFCESVVVTSAQPVAKTMVQAYEAFRDLQPFLSDSTAFGDDKNEKEILSLMTTLRDKFREVGTADSSYHDEAGFVISAKTVGETLDDAITRFKERKRSYAMWQLRRVTQSCTTCHVTYNVSLQFADTSDRIQSLTTLQKVDFYLATRQTDKAEEMLQRAIDENVDPLSSISIARQLLLLYTRVKVDPAKAQVVLKSALVRLKLPAADESEVKQWLVALASWSSGKPSEELSFKKLQSLVRSSVRSEAFEERVDVVTLLRATSGLHQLLRKSSLQPRERSEALFSLGYAYSKLRPFFVDEFPELYLKRCIDDYPHTNEAIKAFKLLREITLDNYTGSAGTELPADVKAQLLQLHDKAYGLLTVSEKS